MSASRVTVVGDGGWGTALALLLAGQGHAVRLWGAFPDYIETMRRTRENAKFLPGIRLPEGLGLESELARAAEGADVLVAAVPTPFLRGVLRRLAACYAAGTPVVSVAKGIENETLMRPSQIIADVLGRVPVAALSGPSHVRRSPHPEIGWIAIETNGRSDLLGPKGTVYAFSSHFDEVVDLDDSFEILASSGNCPIQAFELRGKRAWGIQPHPEIDVPSARRFLKGLVEMKARSWPLFEKALHSESRDSGLISPILRKFLGGR